LCEEKKKKGAGFSGPPRQKIQYSFFNSF